MSGTDLREQRSMAKRRRAWRLVPAFLFVGLIWGGWAWWMDRRYTGSMAEIKAEIMAGRYALACRNLEELLSWKADPDGELVYNLGSCELARGRDQAAEKAWARVVPGSAFVERAIRGRMRLRNKAGRLAAAEQLVKAAAEDPRNDRTGLLVLLMPMFSELGRVDEAERLLEDRWEHFNALGEGALEPAIQLLRLHIDLGRKAAPVEAIRTVVEQAARRAPNDDRVWLGRSNLAFRTGAYDEAGRWLDACLLRRPDDLPVWCARLNWGIATHRVEVVTQAMTHLPAAESRPAEIHRLDAWLASKRGDLERERRALKRLLATDPADLTAVDRLAKLAETVGQPAEAAELRRKRGDIERLRARYEKLHERNQPFRDAVEMARLAEQLGREFEARAFLTVAISENPEREELRHELRRMSSQSSAPMAERRRTLTDVLAHELGNERTVDAIRAR
jgi:tetratricopeptide (TPR) repeat protein